METQITPHPFATTLECLPSGGVVLRSLRDNGEAAGTVYIPAEYVRTAALEMAKCVRQLVDE